MECVDFCHRDIPFGVHLAWFIAWYIFAVMLFEIRAAKPLLVTTFGLVFSILAFLSLLNWSEQSEAMHSLTIWTLGLTPIWFALLSGWFTLKRHRNRGKKLEPYVDKDIRTGWAANDPFDHGL